MNSRHIAFSCLVLLPAWGKKDKNEPDEVVSGDIKGVTETSSGITYKIFTNVKLTTFKGVLVMGSGNNEDDPTPGILDGAAENGDALRSFVLSPNTPTEIRFQAAENTDKLLWKFIKAGN